MSHIRGGPFREDADEVSEFVAAVAASYQPRDVAEELVATELARVALELKRLDRFTASAYGVCRRSTEQAAEAMTSKPVVEAVLVAIAWRACWPGPVPNRITCRVTRKATRTSAYSSGSMALRR